MVIGHGGRVREWVGGDVGAVKGYTVVGTGTDRRDNHAHSSLAHLGRGRVFGRQDVDGWLR